MCKAQPVAVFDGVPAIENALGKGDKLAEDAAMNYAPLRSASLLKTAPEEYGWQIEGSVTNGAGGVAAGR